MDENTSAAAARQVGRFGPLEIAWGVPLRAPRGWTVAHAEWAAEVVPEGPVLDLCCGAGQIGVLAARDAGRPLVAVDVEPAAAAYVRENAEAAGIADRVEFRAASVEGRRHTESGPATAVRTVSTSPGRACG